MNQMNKWRSEGQLYDTVKMSSFHYRVPKSTDMYCIASSGQVATTG